MKIKELIEKCMKFQNCTDCIYDSECAKYKRFVKGKEIPSIPSTLKYLEETEVNDL